MCSDLLAENDIRLVPSVVTQKVATQLVMILDISYFCSHGFVGVLTRVLVTIAASSSFTMNTSTSKCFLYFHDKYCLMVMVV